MQATVRKNFVFDKSIAEYLEELAKDSKKSMTALVQEMIEERHRNLVVKRRMKALKKILGSANGLLVGKTIQSIKAEMDV
jgi:3-methyladenine DNA glycosylase AlkC